MTTTSEFTAVLRDQIGAVADRGGPAVLTDQDTTAIAVTASLLTALARADRAPTRSRVVITGAHTVPLLRPLLIAAGIGEIDSWNDSDAAGCGLTRFAYGADAVIDLIGRTPHLPVFGHIQPIVISPDTHSYGHLAVPGLLTAILRHPERTVDLYYRCALALVAATPPHRLLPDPDLVENIASAAGQVLHRHHHSTATTPGRPLHSHE